MVGVGLEVAMGFGFLALLISTSGWAQNVEPQVDKSRAVTVTGYNQGVSQPILVYESLQEWPDQVRLIGLHLELDGRVLFPAVHIAAYMDEISGTSICKTFGFGSGVLGPASVDSGNFFSMDREGRISDIHYATGDSTSGAGTAEVICDRK